MVLKLLVFLFALSRFVIALANFRVRFAKSALKKVQYSLDQIWGLTCRGYPLVGDTKANKMSVVGTISGVTGTRESLICKSFSYRACQFLSPFCKVIAQKSAIFFGPNSTADAQRVSSSRGCAEGHVCCSPLEQKGGEDFPNLTRKGVFASVPLNNRAVKIFLI